jgi:tetratricopeptide (TPR) repeat protein
MRVLVGYTNQIHEVQTRRPLPGREQNGDDVLAFGAGYTHLHVTPDMRWLDIVAQCPSGWHPDVYIHWSPEYNPVPEGLEEADCLTVGVFGDWNLGGRAMRAVGGLFDALVADSLGCERLRNMGYANVLPALLWAFDPQKHRRLESVKSLEGLEPQTRDIDVLMIGNFNHAVQWERAPWLARVAGLSRQYRVMVTSGLYDEAYVQAMNRAKIVFNRSIRGEANMRAYEAPACGALMFYEAGNREIADIYTDREHCVLYDETNLEELIAYYLAPENDAERERIAQNGWERVQDHSYAHHFARLLTDLEPLLDVRARQVTSETPLVTRQLDLATHWLMTCNVGVYSKADRFLNDLAVRAKADANKPDVQAKIACLHAVLCGETAHYAASPAYRRQCFAAALRHIQRVIQITPDYVLARFNLAYLTLAAGDIRQAETLLQDVAQRLDTAGNENNKSTIEMNRQLHGPTFPRRFDWFDTALEWVYGEFPPGSEAWHTRIRALLTCRVHLTLAETTYRRGQYGDSVRHAERATAAMPMLGEAHYAYACALRAIGRVEDAIAAYRQTLKSMPFNVSARDELARLYLDVERTGDALALLDEWLAILDGCPVYADLRPGADQLRRQAQKQNKQSQQSRQQTIEAGKQSQNGGIKRLLALPDWNRASDWQPIVRAFAQACAPSDPVVLLLRVDPAACPDAHALLQKLERFLLTDIGCAPDALPNITLLTQPLVPADRWKLTYIADAVISDNLPALWRELTQARCVPVLPCSDLKSAANERG